MDTEDELSNYLAALDRDGCYRVDEVYKDGRLETTQRVYFVGENGSELGPFVRKYLRSEAGIGGAYETVFSAQRRGARLSHLPRIIDCHRRDDCLVVIMEHVRGVTLERAVGERDGAAARLELARAVFGDLCDAVSELHEKFDPPLIHRDLKPSNVMVSEGGVTLIDLGIAREWREGGECDTTHFGTRAYAPPEQFGFGQTDVRSDVYALGMLLFFCLSGTAPTAEARERGFAGAGLDEAARRVVARATELDPARRFATVRELRAAALGALDAAAEPEVAPAPAPTPTPVPAREPHRPSRLSRVPVWLGVIWDALVALVALLVLVVCVNSFLNPTPETTSNPTWYNAFGYLLFMPLLFLIWLYQLLDRRPLRRLVPALARLTVRQELLWALGATAVLFVALFLVSIPAVA